MVKILKKEVLTVWGAKSECEFVGVQVGEFILRPDSSSEMRSEELRITRGKNVIVVQGGLAVPLRIWTKEEGLSYMAFQNQLSQEDKFILRELASDLADWVWPDVGEVLRRKIEELGEDNTLRALQNLYKGVGKTMKKINFCKRLPFIGPRLVLNDEKGVRNDIPD